MTSIPFTGKDKFAILAIQELYTNLPSKWTCKLPDGTLAYTEFPLNLEEEWTRWLGTLRIDVLKKSNLILVRTQPSETAGIFDDELKSIFKHLHELFHILQISGVLHYEKADLLAGHFLDGRSMVQQFSEVGPFYATIDSEPIPVDLEKLEESCQVRPMFSAIWSGDDFRRLKYGLSAYFHGLCADAVLLRIHQFVRSLDGLVVTRPGRGLLDFKSRCQTFATASEKIATILEDAYKTRNDVEHLHIERLLEEHRKEEVTRRTRQMESLASFAYHRILTDPDIGKHFVSKEVQQEFWTLGDEQRLDIWGDRIDLAAIP